jgi:cardiolipin synthase
MPNYFYYLMDRTYRLFDDNLELFNSMLKDIASAKRYVFIETYRFGIGSIGEKFRNALIKKAKEGLRVKVLIDGWGSNSDTSFYTPLIEAGVELRIYRKLKFARTYFAKNHCRNHRKLIIIDNTISYIGSSNLTAYSLNWRELNLRINEPTLTKLFKNSFNESFRSYDKYSLSKHSYKRNQYYNSWIFLQDVPNPYRQTIKKKYEQMIDSAEKEIIIESPYFLPGYKLRKKLCEAVERGVNVIAIMPYHSDVHLVDIIRRKYLGELHEGGVTLRFFNQGNLHAKCLMIDNDVFSISSANFDYRSFRYQYEVALIGDEQKVLDPLRNHIDITLSNCQEFNYENWKKRSRVEKFFEWILLPMRYFL